MSVDLGLSAKKTAETTAQDVRLLDPSAREEMLRELGIDLSQLQFQNILSQTGLQDLFGSQVRDIFSPEAMALAEERASKAGQLTEGEDALIRQIQEESLKFGESEIDRFTKEGLGLLKQEIAPSRGLRFADTPILDRGGRIVEEGIRQKSQLLSDIGRATAERRLSFPLQRQQFQEALRENARRYRLALGGMTAQAGLGLSSLIDPYAQQKLFLAERTAQPNTISTGTTRERQIDIGGEYKF